MSTKRETLPPNALEVLGLYKDKAGKDLGPIVEKAFRLGYHMGREQGLYLHRGHNGQQARGKAVKP